MISTRWITLWPEVKANAQTLAQGVIHAEVKDRTVVLHYYSAGFLPRLRADKALEEAQLARV